MRLAALRDLRSLRKAGNSLRRVETNIYKAASEQSPKLDSHNRGKTKTPRRHRDLERMISALDATAENFFNTTGTPLLFRTARSRLYFDQMKNLLEDLGSETIPQWQSYNQFLSRRFFAQLEFTARLGDRMSELWALARSRAEVDEVHTLLWLKKAAQYASLLLVPAAVADMLKDRTSLHTILGDGLHLRSWKWLMSIWHLLPTSIREWWQQTGDPTKQRQEFWLAFVITFCVWLPFILLLRRQGRPQK